MSSYHQIVTESFQSRYCHIILSLFVLLLLFCIFLKTVLYCYRIYIFYVVVAKKLTSYSILNALLYIFKYQEGNFWSFNITGDRLQQLCGQNRFPADGQPRQRLCLHRYSITQVALSTARLFLQLSELGPPTPPHSVYYTQIALIKNGRGQQI